MYGNVLHPRTENEHVSVQSKNRQCFETQELILLSYAEKCNSFFTCSEYLYTIYSNIEKELALFGISYSYQWYKGKEIKMWKLGLHHLWQGNSPVTYSWQCVTDVTPQESSVRNRASHRKCFLRNRSHWDQWTFFHSHTFTALLHWDSYIS